MSWFRQLFDSRHRRARAAEAQGRWREAAAHWAEAGEPDLAASALLHLAERSEALDAKLDAWLDALRWIPEDAPERRRKVERDMGRAVLADARDRGAVSAREKRRLADAARRLERAEAPVEAAEAYRVLGRVEDEARCLEAAGEVEALESLLERTTDEDRRRGLLRTRLANHELAMRYGARREARDALRQALEAAGDDPELAARLAAFEERVPTPFRLRARVGDRTLYFAGRYPVGLGRDTDIPLRGVGVSRHHAELSLDGNEVRLRDAGSRNGTLLQGIPITAPLTVHGAVEVGLGDHVRLAVVPLDEQRIHLRVIAGADRGIEAWLGKGPLPVPGLGVAVDFDGGWPVLKADPGRQLMQHGQVIQAPIQLLAGDRIAVGDATFEVLR